MVSVLGDRIKRLREQRGLSQKEVADRMGNSDHTIRNWEKGLTSPTAKNLTALAAILQVQEGDLVNRRAQSSASHDGQQSENRVGASTGSAGASGRSEGRRGPPPDYFNVAGRLEDLRPPGARPLPVYRWGSMGDPRDHESAPSPDREEYPPTGREGLIGPRGFAVEVRGNSMSGRDVRDGDLVWVNPDKPYRLGSLVLALVDEGDGESGMVVKLYARTEVGECLMSDSEDAGRSTVPCSEFRVVGPVVWVQRGFPPR